MRWAIWYHLYNFKNVKNIHGGVLLLVKWLKPATLLKVTLLDGCFSLFLNCTDGTNSRNASYSFFVNLQAEDEHCYGSTLGRCFSYVLPHKVMKTSLRKNDTSEQNQKY